MDSDRNGQPLVRLDRVSLSRNGRTILRELSWSLQAGESWLVSGSNGAGKTTFLHLARGDIWPDGDGRGQRLYCTDGRPEKSPLAFRRISGLCSPALLSVYRSHELNLPVLEVLAGGLFDAPRRPADLSGAQWELLQKTAAELELEAVLDRGILELSNGQAQKVLLARALVKGPQVLFLDEIGDSLDGRSRRLIQEAVQSRSEKGTQIIQATHRPEAPFLENLNRLELHWGRSAGQASPAERFRHESSSPTGEDETVMTTVGRLENRRAFQPKSPAYEQQSGQAQADPIVTIENADVVLNGRPALQAVSWTVRRNEHWAITGPNGSGKSTLLRLILGEVHPLPGGRVERLSLIKPSLEDIRRRIGHYSPDLEALHTRRQTGLETVLSGLFGHIGLHRPVSAEDVDRARDWLDGFGLAKLADRDIGFLSCGELRQLLLIRAMIQEPELLLVDEPFSGLDAASRRRLFDLLQALAQGPAQLIMVAHRQEDLPAWLDKRLILKEGRIQSILP